MLTDNEKLRFADYCYQRAKDNKALAKQMEGLEGLEGLHYQVLADKYAKEAIAFAIVAKELEPIESFDIPTDTF